MSILIKKKSSSGGLSGGAIAGIIIGCLVLLIAIFIIVCACRKKPESKLVDESSVNQNINPNK